MIGPAFNHRSQSQAQRFTAIATFFDENRRIPTYRELADMFGWSSTNASWRVVQTLIGSGALIKHPTPGGFILIPAGRRVSNKRGKLGVSDRLPAARTANDNGLVYVIRREAAYKIGFTRTSLARRVRDSGGTLLFTIPVSQRPAQFEYILNNRFAAKRLPPQGNKAGDKREWFALDDADLEWLRGLGPFHGRNSLTATHR